MESLLLKIFGFVIVIGILVTVHEFGHFWVARKVGIKVLRFSIGFGRPLLSWRRAKEGADGTEYLLSAIPLGGYVKMLDEREGDVPKGQEHLSFNRQPLWARSAVVAAGPIFNLTFAVLAFWALLVIGESGLRPLVGEVKEGSPAAVAGFRVADEIISVNQKATPSWSQVFYQMASASATGAPMQFVVKDDLGGQRNLSLGADALGDFAELSDPLQSFGVEPDLPKIPLLVGEVSPDGAAAEGGLMAGDLLVSVNGQPMADWGQWVQLIRASPGQVLDVAVQRDGRQARLQIIPQSIDVQGKTIGRIGAAGKAQPELWEKYRVAESYGLAEAVPLAFEKTWDFSVLTLKVMWRIVTGEASLKNLGGPITMADAAGHAVSAGLAQFLKLLAIISVSLGVMNLLPVPILDGGHLVYFAIEGITGSPVSEKIMAIGQQIGMGLLLALMGLVMYQDILRVAG